MGCIKSKHACKGSNAIHHKKISDDNEECTGKKSSLIVVTMDEKGPPSTIVLDYADHLACEILDQAMKQAITESKYSDIPYIESDVP
ncbi:SMAKA protein, partial [Geococcyx californianus]|nr:SMAKA protein [Geococcyx californianus]